MKSEGQANLHSHVWKLVEAAILPLNFKMLARSKLLEQNSIMNILNNYQYWNLYQTNFQIDVSQQKKKKFQIDKDIYQNHLPIKLIINHPNPNNLFE